MKFSNTRFWKNYKKYDTIVGNSSMRSTVDGLLYWKLLNRFNFNNFLEIGAYQGLTTGLFFESNSNAKVTVVDPTYRFDLFHQIYPECSNRLRYINKCSLTAPFDDQIYDFVLVDGDHSYEYAIADINKSLPLLSKHGVLAIDDYKMPGVEQALQNLYNQNTDWVPFLRLEQTEFWHHRSCDRSEFLDSLFNDPISNFIFISNFEDNYSNTITSAKTLHVFTDVLDFFNLALEHYDI